MSIQNLKCKYQQLQQIALANAAAKILAIKNSVIARKNQMTAAAISAANAVIEPILAQAGAVSSAVSKGIQNATDAANAAREQLRKLLERSPDACSILPPTYDSTKPSENVTATTLALPSTNETPIGEAQNKALLEDSKSNTLDKQIENIGIINKTLSNKGALEIREYVRLLKYKHPIIDTYLQNLNYFQPVSDYVGSSFLAYTPDKPSLLLEDWKTDKPKSLRQNLLHKIPTNTITMIDNNYQQLNKQFYSNISNEFLQERRPLLNYCHGYHITGDVMWITNHVDPSQPLIIKLIQQLSTNRVPIILIDYLTPITESLQVENDYFDNTIEKISVLLDLKGNALREPTTTVNNSALYPVEPSES